MMISPAMARGTDSTTIAAGMKEQRDIHALMLLILSPHCLPIPANLRKRMRNLGTPGML